MCELGEQWFNNGTPGCTYRSGDVRNCKYGSNLRLLTRGMRSIGRNRWELGRIPDMTCC